MGTIHTKIKHATWKDVYTINSYEVDITRHATLTALCNYFQESAWHHADHLNVGFNEFSQDRFLWVLSRLFVRVIRFPLWGERIRVETWPKGTDKLFALRDFCVTDEKKQSIVLATSAWLVIDGSSRKPVRPDFLHTLLDVSKGKSALDEPLTKLVAANVANQETLSYKVRYSDLDLNNHVNNAKYIEWILNTYSKEYHKHHIISSLTINYMAETHIDEEIIISRSSSEHDPLCDMVVAQKKENNADVFRSRIYWTKC